MPDDTDLLHDESTAELIASLAEIAGDPDVIDPQFEGEYVYALPIGTLPHRLTFKGRAVAPHRKMGETALHTPASFKEFVTLHAEAAGDGAAIYADADHLRFVAVFNDADGTDAGWADHRAVLTLKRTPEWNHWASQDNKYLAQSDFADHLETGLSEIARPPAADLFDLAKSFHATTKAIFKSDLVLESGQRQVQYEETIDASAGRKKELTIPKEFELVLAPFDGAKPVFLMARLRYRIGDGKLVLGYSLVRPDKATKEAFEAEAEAIHNGTNVRLLMGTPPTGVNGS